MLSDGQINEAEAASGDEEAKAKALRGLLDDALLLKADATAKERREFYARILAARLDPGDADQVLAAIAKQQKPVGIKRRAVDAEFRAYAKGHAPEGKEAEEFVSPAARSPEEKARLLADVAPTAQPIIDYGDNRMRLAAETCAHLYGIVGDPPAFRAALLASISPLTGVTFSVRIAGGSGAGKTFPADCALSLICPSLVYRATLMSARSLAYTPRDLRYVCASFPEAGQMLSPGTADNPNTGALLLRSILTEERIQIETVTKGSDGQLRTISLNKEGPIAAVFCSSAEGVDRDMTTRVVRVESDASAAHTDAILAARAARAAEGRIAPKPMAPSPDAETAGALAPWHAYSLWLHAQGPFRVSIPFANALHKSFNRSEPRVRRLQELLFAAIMANAVLNLPDRKRGKDGVVIATIRDYEAARDLVLPSVSSAARRDKSAALRYLPILLAIRFLNDPENKWAADTACDDIPAAFRDRVAESIQAARALNDTAASIDVGDAWERKRSEAIDWEAGVARLGGAVWWKVPSPDCPPIGGVNVSANRIAMVTEALGIARSRAEVQRGINYLKAAELVKVVGGDEQEGKRGRYASAAYYIAAVPPLAYPDALPAPAEIEV